MIFPIRCFSCGKPIGHLWFKYKELLQQGKTPKEALDELKIERICCRQIFLSHYEEIEELAHIKKI